MAQEVESERGPASQSEVIIVGAGPAGLFAACELLRHGVRPRVIESRLQPHHETRGTAIQPAVLETLDRAGVIGAFLDQSVRIHEFELMGPGQRQIALSKLAGLGCKYEFQCSQPQWFTESVLRDHLAGLELRVEFGAEVTSIEPEADGLRVRLVKEGRDEIVRAAYVIGAEGGHSVTRHSMHERLDGETYRGRYIVADVEAHLPIPPGRGRAVVGREGFVLFSPLPDKRWLIFVNRDEVDQRDQPPAAAALAALVNSRVGADIGLADLRWASFFKMQGRSAPWLSDGRRFLLGDAAHLSSPLGGEGINSALMDGADIAWKLALVLRGAAKPSLLESYAAERGLADRHVVEVSNEIHTFIMQLVAACASGGAPAAPEEDPAQRLAGLRRRSMLDVSYAGAPLIGPADASSDKPAPGDRFPDWLRLRGDSHQFVFFGRTHGLEAFRKRWGQLAPVANGKVLGLDPARAGLPDGGAVLVRPDGFIGFRAAPADEVAMKALDTHLASYLTPGFAPAGASAAAG